MRALAPRRTVESRGLLFTLQSENWITHYRWRSYNTKEPETLDWIDERVRDGDNVFDIGANIGVYSLYIAMRHPNARVVAFEPEYSNLHLLRDNVVANGLQERIEIFSVALSDRDGLSRLWIQDLTPGAALHTESRHILTSTRTGRRVIYGEGVAALTLDAFCEHAGYQPNAIKVDVDGTELEILRGGAQTLRSTALRSVLLEVPQQEDAVERCRALLLEAGFRREDRPGPAGPGANEVWSR